MGALGNACPATPLPSMRRNVLLVLGRQRQHLTLGRRRTRRGHRSEADGADERDNQCPDGMHGPLSRCCSAPRRCRGFTSLAPRCRPACAREPRADPPSTRSARAVRRRCSTRPEKMPATPQVSVLNCTVNAFHAGRVGALCCAALSGDADRCERCGVRGFTPRTVAAIGLQVWKVAGNFVEIVSSRAPAPPDTRGRWRAHSARE